VRRNVESSIGQLVEIAVRALSPGINDPDTALTCIDQLVDAVGLAGGRRIPPSLVRRDGEIRLVTYPLDFNHLLSACFDSIRQYGRGSVPVAVRLLEGLASLGSRMQSESHREALLHHAAMVWRSNQGAIPEPDDLRFIQERYHVAERALVDAGGTRLTGATRDYGD